MNRYDQARQDLRRYLLNYPLLHRNEWNERAKRQLLRHLYQELCTGSLYSGLLYPHGPPQEGVQQTLKEAQGAVAGIEFSEAARGRPCGHIFDDGEATYYCRTCTADDTCVLCTRCFHASNHEGHHVTVSISSGGGGCCDCGDPEAWKREVICSIHTRRTDTGSGDGRQEQHSSSLPSDFRNQVEGTVSAAMDYLIDVFSCSPESMRFPKSDNAAELIRKDEELSRLESLYPGPTIRSEIDPTFVLVLWNDEKHTVVEVEEQVARATRQTRSFGTKKAWEVNDVGRSYVSKSTNVDELVQQARILSQIKLTTTIRSSRDTFREEMCATIIEWLNDIAGCSAGDDHQFLLETVCRQLLQPWNVGSKAFNLLVARDGHEDHQASDARLHSRSRNFGQRIIQQRMRLWQRRAQERQQDGTETQPDGDDDDAEIDEDDDDEEDVDDVMEIDQDGDVLFTVDETNEAAMDAINLLMDQTQATNDQSDETEDDTQPVMEQQTDPNTLYAGVPRPRRRAKHARDHSAPSYWIADTSKSQSAPMSSPEEDLSKRVRVDYLVFYDMRMWKTLRQKLRHLYISTLVTVPKFKRILSLRFAELYTHLSQLYLLADREAEHSIISMSLQMLTTPTIAGEIVVGINFFTRLLAILYTFLTTRQVGEPQDVDPTATISFETGTLSNRRFVHLFHDLKYLLEVPAVRDYIRTRSVCILQFLDFAKLFQGICPNVRVVGEHVEYESDAWMMASQFARDVSRSSKQLCDCFPPGTQSINPMEFIRAIRPAAKAATISSTGAEAKRFKDAELKKPVEFWQLPKFDTVPATDPCHKPIVKYEVEKSSISLWHPLHYILSWLIDSGKSMASQQLAGLLSFEHSDLQSSDQKIQIPVHDREEYLLATFDMPLRICAFLAQVRAGMWVRNGMAVRNQVEYYRSVQRDLSHQRDIYMVQAAFVVCNPSRFLASVIDRFTMERWVHGDFVVKQGFEDHQMIDVAEEFLHLLVVTLCDRTLLLPQEVEPNLQLAVARRDIVHALCFKPLTHSELSMKLSERVTSLDEYEEMLFSVADYRAPEGLSDAGTLRLKERCFDEVDPYFAYYNKSQREEAETILRNRVAQQNGTPFEETFWTPRPRPISIGVFSGIATFTQTPLFAQIVRSFLYYAEQHRYHTPGIQPARVEALLQVLLHLMLIAVKEDRQLLSPAATMQQSFVANVCRTEWSPGAYASSITILAQLFYLQSMPMFGGSTARIRFVIQAMRQAYPAMVDEACQRNTSGMMDLDSLVSTGRDRGVDAASKKREALARQAKVMASFKRQQSEFLENQTMDWGDDVMSDSDDDFASAVEVPSKTWDLPGGNCILCQEEAGEHRLYGTLAFVAQSKIFRQTDLGDRRHIVDVLSTSLQLDQSLEAVRQARTLNEAAGRDDSSNDAGEQREDCEGFPPAHLEDAPVFSGCGHVMHWSCFQDYWAATTRRHYGQHARAHPEHLHKKEFVCPLCKALGNTFMPVSWRPQEAIEASDRPIDFAEWVSDGTKLHSLANETAIPYIRSLEGECARRTFGSAPSVAAWAVHLQELSSAQDRLSQTLKGNGLFFAQFPMHDDARVKVETIDRLIESFGSTVAATEIAHRGTALPHSTAVWIESLSPQLTLQLRTLHETILAFACVAVNKKDGNHEFLSYSNANAQVHLNAMFSTALGDHGGSCKKVNTDFHKSLFSQDVFTYLAKLSFYLGPTNMDDFTQIMRVALYAEIVKITLAAVMSPVALEALANQVNSATLIPSTPQQAERFSIFVQDVIEQHNQARATLRSPWMMSLTKGPELTTDPNMRVRFDAVLRSLIFHYALTFARQCLLLMHIRFGFDYSQARPSEAGSELDRLSTVLGLPSVDDLVAVPYSASSSTHHTPLRPNPLYRLMHNWILHAVHYVIGRGLYFTLQEDPEKRRRAEAEYRWRIELAHPTLFELVKLPQTHDTLNAVVLDKRCPTTGGPLQDPCICLLCGSIFCGQSKCCTKNNLGGCNQHVAVCGHNIGIFLDIRKCAVLFLHYKNGSYFTAPYLDRHGEADMGLRRHRQLFLNQKRYDRLFRDVWLGANGGIPSAVARKLDSEINTGGWETL